MSKARNEEKIQRMLKFLLSMQNASIAARMRLRGFGDEDRHEGFKRLDKAAGRHLSLDER